jgi:hypothetical protein
MRARNTKVEAPINVVEGGGAVVTMVANQEATTAAMQMEVEEDQHFWQIVSAKTTCQYQGQMVSTATMEARRLSLCRCLAGLAMLSIKQV